MGRRRRGVSVEEDELNRTCGFRVWLAELGITHRRGGHPDPESQAFIGSLILEA